MLATRKHPQITQITTKELLPHKGTEGSKVSRVSSVASVGFAAKVGEAHE